jgi:TPR repeat protein
VSERPVTQGAAQTPQPVSRDEQAAPAASAEPDEPVLDAPPPVPACGDGARCFAQGQAAVRQQPKRAAELFAESCDQDHPQACRELAVLYEEGRGVAQDDRRAKQLREHACSLGSTAACDELGH